LTTWRTTSTTESPAPFGEEITDNLEDLLAVLPPHVVEALEAQSTP